MNKYIEIKIYNERDSLIVVIQIKIILVIDILYVNSMSLS